MIVFDLGDCAQASHTPVPSREGRFGCCVLVGNEWFVVLLSFLQRGVYRVLAFGGLLSGDGFPDWGEQE